MIDLTALAAHFAPDRIEWRVGSTTRDKDKGMALAYLTARDVMDRLDAVCGPANWQDRYEFHGPRTVCYLSLRIGEEWITKADGAGDSDVEAEKGAISDALKRCAVKWGIGRYLYDLESPWVEIEPAGKSFKIKPNELKRLEQILSRQTKSVQPAPEKPKPAANDTTDDRQKTACDALIGALSYANSVRDLRDWKDLEKHHIDGLDDFHFERFKKAYKAKEIALLNGEPVNLLGAG